METKEKKLQAIYKDRINRVFQYIDENLDADLSLKTVSEVAFFSPFHFHRIFKFITNETLKGYVKRKKIEKAALDLLHKNKAIHEIAHNCGFSDLSAFSKAFKKFYDVNPTEFKKQNANRYKRIQQLKSKNGQVDTEPEKYICIINNLKNWIMMHANIEVRVISKMDLAYVSCINPQTLGVAYEKLIQWAASQGLMSDKTKLVTIYHDTFKVTEEPKVRVSASMVIDKPVKVSEEIGLTSIEAGRYIVGSFEIVLDDFEKSWTGLYLWMNENGYIKADKKPFEVYHNNFNEHPEKKSIVDFYIPIE